MVYCLSLSILMCKPLPSTENDKINAIIEKATHYLLEGKINGCEGEILKLKDKWPQYYRLLMGNFCYLEADYEQALKKYRKSLEYDPSLAEAHKGLAATHFVMGDYREAMDECNKALQLEPNNVEYRLLSVVILNRKGDLKEALKKIQILVKQYPDKAAPYYYLGEVYKNMNNKEKALEALLKAIEKDKTFLESYPLAIELLIDLNKKEQALELWAEYYKLKPEGQPDIQNLQELLDAYRKPSKSPTAGPPRQS